MSANAASALSTLPLWSICVVLAVIAAAANVPLFVYLSWTRGKRRMQGSNVSLSAFLAVYLSLVVALVAVTSTALILLHRLQTTSTDVRR